MLQVAGYAGLAVGLEGMHALREVFDAESAPEPETPEAGAADGARDVPEDRFERGRAILAILRPERAQAPPPARDEVAPDWRTWLIGTAFGDLWARPGLTLVERERITMAVLIVLSHEAELRSHVTIASNLGIPPTEIGEQIMHLAFYVGFPTAVAAIRVASQVLRDRKGSEHEPAW